MTTIFYPDVSHYDRDRGVTIEANTVAVVAKCTHGTAFVDSAFTTFRQQAAAQGSIFAGYHWLNHGNVQAQAAAYFKAAGKTPCMIDAEDTDKNTGYNGPLTIADIVGFAMALRALGGICNLVYLPRWYWDSHMGGPSLQPLQDASLHLVSSNYTAYSDAGPGWNVYVRDNGAVEPSGMRPMAWQYTDALSYGGGTSDFNAFKGTPAQFEALLTTQGVIDMAQLDDIQTTETDDYWWSRATMTGRGKDGNPMRDTWDGAVIPGTRQLGEKLDALSKAVTAQAQAVGAPTQDQVNAAVLNAMLDPRVQKGIGDAITSHLHVS